MLVSDPNQPFSVLPCPGLKLSFKASRSVFNLTGGLFFFHFFCYFGKKTRLQFDLETVNKKQCIRFWDNAMFGVICTMWCHQNCFTKESKIVRKNKIGKKVIFIKSFKFDWLFCFALDLTATKEKVRCEKFSLLCPVSVWIPTIKWLKKTEQKK